MRASVVADRITSPPTHSWVCSSIVASNLVGRLSVVAGGLAMADFLVWKDGRACFCL